MFNNELQIKLTKKYLKFKMVEDRITFKGHEKEKELVYELARRVVVNGESHSAVVIGPRGCGKTTLMNSIVDKISKEISLDEDVQIVMLNGLLHHEEKQALKSITGQMKLENVVGSKTFRNFTENFLFLLECLQSGVDRQCKSLVFVLDEFEMFCRFGTQTLLYNLFDITHNRKAPMFVVGLTSRFDYMDLLEKRVKSRFSHRNIYLFSTGDPDFEIENGITPKTPVEIYTGAFVRLLSLPLKNMAPKGSNNRKKDEEMEPEYRIPEQVFKRLGINDSCFDELDPDFVLDWNDSIKKLSENQDVLDQIEKYCYYNVNEQIFRDILFQIVSKLSPTKLRISVSDLTAVIDKTLGSEQKILLLQSLSILELSLVIAMKHAKEIFDGQPMNFEMILHRYMKFAKTNSSAQTYPRPVLLKAFEHLQELELIVAAQNHIGQATQVQKEYQLFHLAVPPEDLEKAIRGFKSLPTEVEHWLDNSVI